MIASNFRRYPDALALQLPLPFGWLLTWHTARPGSRLLRAIRAARTAAFKAAGRTRKPAKAITPAWWREAKARAKSLARDVKASCKFLHAPCYVWEGDVNTFDSEYRLVDFHYADYLYPDGLDRHGMHGPSQLKLPKWKRDAIRRRLAAAAPSPR